MIAVGGCDGRGKVPTATILGDNVAEQTIHTQATRTDIRQAIASIPAHMRGAAASAIMLRVGLALLGRIRTAFIAKARGGTDEAGDRWAPLSPKTIAYSRRHRKLEGNPSDSPIYSKAKNKPWIPKASKRASSAPSYALTNKQRARWWQVYRQQLAIYKGNKGHAAAVAWIVLKREGATTLIDKYVTAKVEILRDTGLLLNSLSPGIGGAEQVLRTGPGECIVGTNRKWAGCHHRGVPGRIPQRRLWPEPGRWPKNWWTDLTEQLKGGILDLIVFLIKGI